MWRGPGASLFNNKCAMSWRPASAATNCCKDVHAAPLRTRSLHFLLDARPALMASYFTIVANTTKHSAPMANVARLARLKTSFISAPIHFPFRAEPAHQQPVLLPIRMPPDFRDRHLRDRNKRLLLATAIAAAWLCVVASPWHVATRQPGWLVARVPLAETPEGMMRIAFQSRIVSQIAHHLEASRRFQTRRKRSIVGNDAIDHRVCERQLDLDRSLSAVKTRMSRCVCHEFMDSQSETPTPLRFKRQGVGYKGETYPHRLQRGSAHGGSELANVFRGVNQSVPIRDGQKALNVRALLQQFDDIAQRNLDLRFSARTAAADTMLIEETSSLRIR